MGIYEAKGKSDEWYTPKYIFEAMETNFDLDVSAPINREFCHVPASNFITENSLSENWFGFIWMNAPFGNQKDKFIWLEKFIQHSNGIALTPDRTSAPWWQHTSKKTDGVLFIDGKPKFIRPNGTVGESPGNGVTLFASGEKAVNALVTAENNGLGIFYEKRRERVFIVGISFDNNKTWRVIVGEALEELQKEASLSDIYEVVIRLAPNRIKTNINYKAKVRQTLQMHYERIATATYKLN